MEADKMAKKGSMVQNSDGTLLLVNEKNQAYRVSNAVVAVWEICDGKSPDEVASEVAKAMDTEVEKVKTSVTDVITKLKEVELVK